MATATDTPLDELDLSAFSAAEAFRLDATPFPTTPAEVSAAYCLSFLRAIRDVSFATVDATDLPAVRIIDVMMVSIDPLRLYFLTPRGKSFHEDLMRSGFVALVGQTPDFRTCRLRGPVVHPENTQEQHALVDAMFALNPSMNELYPGDKRRIIDAFYIQDGEGEYFDLGQQPLLRVPFTIGKGICPEEAETRNNNQTDLPPGFHGYFITDSCQECGACAAVCPARCIEAGTPYRIQQEHCQRCGLCTETCPFDAIIHQS